MKKKPILIVVLSLFIFLLLPSCASKRVTYEVDPDVCQAVFGCGPHGFVIKEENEFHREIDDFYISAKVENENLVLVMSEEQLEQWRRRCLEDIEKACQTKSIDVAISEDYTQIICGYTKKSSLSDEFQLASLRLTNCCTALQFINNPSKENISVEYRIIDATTKEIKFSKRYPQDLPWTFSFSSFDFFE